MVHTYDRVRHISTGRFGVTMLTKADGQLFVMKTIDVGRLDGKARGEVLHEVSAIAYLRHPHLVSARECFLESGMMCIISDYAEGGHVAGHVEKIRKAATLIAEPQILQWLGQATLALNHLHERSVLHRDIRARRLLLTSKGHVVVSGATVSVLLARSLAPERPDLEAYRYLAPELVASTGTHSRASDLWALGVVLYELLALRPPFEHSHPQILVQEIRAGPLPTLPARCSPDIRLLCTSILRRDPANRQTAAGVLREPALQARLLSLLNEESNQLPEFRVGLGRGRAETSVGFGAGPQRRQDLSHTYSASPRNGTRTYCGPSLLAAPKSTPRGLQRVGEVCIGKPCKELIMPRAALIRKSISSDTSQLLPLASEAVINAWPTSPISATSQHLTRPSTESTTVEVASELASDLVAVMMDSVQSYQTYRSFTAANLLGGAVP